jgi:multidrug efflux pump subunit AcrA (membrane-fusion protein)
MVPRSAVLNSGDRQTVFVDRGNGNFEPRSVQVGLESGDRIEILRGLKAGERIVTSGNFLLDSESQLQDAMKGMPGMAPAAPPEASPKPEPPAMKGMKGMDK